MGASMGRGAVGRKARSTGSLLWTLLGHQQFLPSTDALAHMGLETASRLRLTLRETLAPLLPREEPYALLGYPAHGNVGDSAIWLGALALLDDAGAGRPAYSCSTKTYDAITLRRQVGSGPILLTGGGNFGDMYTSIQVLRERVVRDFPENRVVQLPQTIHYRSASALEASRRVFAGHRDFTVFVRDEPSLAVARDRLGLRSVLAPDLAFALGPLPRPEPHGAHIVWLLRSDGESKVDRFRASGLVSPVDWPPETRQGLFAIQRRLRKRVARAPFLRRRLAALLRRTFEPAARRRLHRGRSVLGAGRAVVTDRLHGHILCLLMGIPHVVLDNSYGKVRHFHESWTEEAPTAIYCGGSAEECSRLLDDVGTRAESVS